MGVLPSTKDGEGRGRGGVTEPQKFPDGFLWGTSSAAHQVEGDNRNNDWWEFEQKAGHIANGDTSEIACDHYHRYREDFALLRELNQNVHRLSIEWSRIEPNEREFDSRQMRHYRDVLGDLREQGIAPMLTLHHFTNPLWFVRKGGWAANGAAHAFLPFVHKVVDELGDLVTLWCTINEPVIYATNGWLTGDFPPGRKGAIASVFRITGNLRRAHEMAYEAIKRRFPDAGVGLSHHKFLFLPASNRPQDRLAAGIAQATLDRWPVAPGVLKPVVEARCDYVGIAHYWGQSVAFNARRPKDQFIRRFNPPGVPLTDMGWGSNPRWMRQVLNELKPLHKPVYVTENGIATGQDATRAAYLKEILEQVRLAIEDGVDVRGYFHWTNTDNFEWSRGYHARFGLIDVDRTRATLDRTIKPSGRLYGRIAKANAIVD